MEAISDLPVFDDMDADYSPQYLKLAHVLRDNIESGHHRYGTTCPRPTWQRSTAYPCGWHYTRW